MQKLCVVGLVLSFAGCERYVENDSPAITAFEREYVAAFVLDVSPSFTDQMFDGDGVGYKFFLRASEQLFRDRMGENDRILISQLSAESRTLLWEGAPLALRRRFGSSDALRQFIEERSDPAGSRAFAAVADTADYLCDLPGVSEGKTKVCLLVLSDMLDNSRTQKEDLKRMLESLKRFTQAGGCVGLYWVDQGCLSSCRRCFADAGIPAVIEGDIVDEPRLPSFQ